MKRNQWLPHATNHKEQPLGGDCTLTISFSGCQDNNDCLGSQHSRKQLKSIRIMTTQLESVDVSPSSLLHLKSCQTWNEERSLVMPNKRRVTLSHFFRLGGVPLAGSQKWPPAVMMAKRQQPLMTKTITTWAKGWSVSYSTHLNPYCLSTH